MGFCNPFKNLIYVKAFVRYNYLRNNSIPNGTALALLLEMELLLMLSVFTIILSFLLLPLLSSKVDHWYLVSYTLTVTLCNLFWFSDLRKLVFNLDISLYELPHDIRTPSDFNNPFSLYRALLGYKHYINRYRYTAPTVRYLFKKIAQTVNVVRALIIAFTITMTSMVTHPVVAGSVGLLIFICLTLIYFFAKDIVIRLSNINLIESLKDDW